MCQVQEIALVAAEEVVALQLLLRVLDGPGADILILRGVVNEAVALALHKGNVLHRQLHSPSFDGDGDIGALPAAHPAQRPAQPLGEGGVAHRLEHVVQRVHLIASDGVLGHVGNKDDDDLRVGAADQLRGGHSIQKAHLDI